MTFNWTLQTQLRPSSDQVTGAALGDTFLLLNAQFSNALARSIDAGQTWAALTVPAYGGTGWKGLAAGNGVFVATSYGKAIYSTDGITWGSVALTGGCGFRGVFWTGSAFLAIGENGAASFSTDGATWVRRDITGAPTFASGVDAVVTFAGKTYVHGVNSATLYVTANDGVAWTTQALPYSYRFNGGASNAERMVLVANEYSTRNDRALVTTDGTTWTEAPFTGHSAWLAGSESQGGIVFAGDQFVVVGMDAYTITATSPDGLTWTYHTQPIADVSQAVTNGNTVVGVGTSDASVLTAYIAGGGVQAPTAFWTLFNGTQEVLT